MTSNMTTTETVHLLIERLSLVPHPEGGYFCETYRGGSQPMKGNGRTTKDGKKVSTEMLKCWDQPVERLVMSSIYWLMEKNSTPFLWWGVNKSDHVHYWHGGDSVVYHLISPEGEYTKKRLGGSLDDVLNKNAQPQVIVEGGTWKAAELDGDYCLIGEGVAPGFDFEDFKWGTKKELFRRVGYEWGIILQEFLNSEAPQDFDAFYKNEHKMSEI